MANSATLTSIARIKNYYLKGVLAVYIIAFTSLYVQVQSLFGDNGIVPLKDLANKNKQPTGPLDQYNVVLVAPKIGLSHATFIELICIVSVLIAFSALFFRRLLNALTFGLLWYVYYSICSVGQGFMSFHSDLLLLEVGFITILLAPFIPSSKMSQADHDHLSFFLVKWLVFRYFVSNVLNVYLDGDKAWYNMTAIPLVAQGVQFPSTFSWQIFNLPTEYIKLLQAYEHTVKLCTPFLFLIDLKYTRFLAFYSLLFIAGPSALFFNFGWTDILIVVCLLSYLKDAYFYSDRRAKQSSLTTLLDILVSSAYVGAVAYVLVKFYGIKYIKGTFHTQVVFTPAQFKQFADHLVPISFGVGILGLLSAAYTTYFKSSKKTSIVKTLVYTVIVVALFFSTFPTLTRFAPGLEAKVKPLALTKDLSRLAAPFHLSNNYLILSKVSQYYAEGRPELQIQARPSAEDTTWEQYEFRFKPGQHTQELTRLVPHIPRVDLKLWYAARATLQNNQWVQTLAYRLATKDKDVLDAVAPGSNVSKVGQVRVATMKYKYSTKARQPTTGYWVQPEFISEYLPVTTVDNLKFAVKSNGISLAPAVKQANETKLNSLEKLLNKYLEISSNYIRGVAPTAVIWTLAAIAAVSMLR